MLMNVNNVIISNAELRPGFEVRLLKLMSGTFLVSFKDYTVNTDKLLSK